VDVVFFDYVKAFDKVSHTGNRLRLAAKLWSHGIEGRLESVMNSICKILVADQKRGNYSGT